MQEENILKQAGLSEEQAVTYEALLDKGPQKASTLALWTGIKRSLTYKVLEQLENMGLVEKKGGAGTVALFYPAHPSILLDKIDRDKKNLELAKEVVSLGIGNLASKYNLIAGKPNIRFFEGIDGLRILYDEMISTTKEILIIQSPIDKSSEEITAINEENVRLRIKNNITTRAISPLCVTTKAKISIDPEKLIERRIIDDEIYKIDSQIIIFNNVVAITDYSGKNIITTIINNQSIANTQKALFAALWDELIDKQAEYIEKIKD